MALLPAAEPPLESLRCFVAAARLLNFRAAARAVALTPAALGQRIRQLEELCGRPLFARTTRVVMLTEAGLSLLPAAEACLAQASACLRAARGETGPPPIELTVGTRHELGMSWLVPELDRLIARFPHVDFHLYFGSGSDLVLRVRTLEIDCAITSTRVADPRVDAIRLHREDYAFVASPALLAKRPLSKPAHAAEHTLFDTTSELPLFRYFREAIDTPNTPNTPSAPDAHAFGRVTKLGGIEAIRTRVLAGAGVAVLPEYLVGPDLAKKRLKRVFPRVKPLSDHFRLLFRANDPRASLFASLASALLETPLR